MGDKGNYQLPDEYSLVIAFIPIFGFSYVIEEHFPVFETGKFKKQCIYMARLSEILMNTHPASESQL